LDQNFRINIRIFIIITIVILLIFFIVGIVNGQESIIDYRTLNKEKLIQGVRFSSDAEKVGNRVCPVSGLKIRIGEEIRYEYKGKIYNFISTLSVELFKKNPEKYIQFLKNLEKVII